MKKKFLLGVKFVHFVLFTAVSGLLRFLIQGIDFHIKTLFLSLFLKYSEYVSTKRLVEHPAGRYG